MKIFKQIILFGITFIFIMTLCELFIRTTQLASLYPMDFYEDIGKGRRRNLDYVYFNEGFGIGNFNEYRYIGEANPPRKPKNTVRIALLGDSYVESFEVFQRNYFGNIAENTLSKLNPKKKFEILNFGRANFDIANMYVYHILFVNNFNPDYILYMISEEDLEPKFSDPLIPKAVLVKDSLILSFKFAPSKLKIFEKTKFLIQHSYLLNMFSNTVKKAKQTSVLAILLDKIYIWYYPIQEELNDEKYSEYKLNPVTERIIKVLDSKKVIFVNRDMEELPVKFQKLIFDNGFKYFDLSIPLNKMLEDGIDPKEWNVTNKRLHWNQEAHLVIGEELSKFIESINQK